MLFYGVCHGDLHQARTEWGNTVYPCMPGHEGIGRVTRGDGGAAGGRYVATERDAAALKPGLDFILRTLPQRRDLTPSPLPLKRVRLRAIIRPLDPMDHETAASHRMSVAGR